MRYRVNWCFYAREACAWRSLARLLDEYPESQVINVHPDQVQPILARLERYAVRELHASYYCRLPLDTPLPPPAWPTRQATAADVQALVELYATAGIMRRDADSLRGALQRDHIALTEAGGKIVSAALTTTETSSAAMIGGVFTPAPWRKRGYASAALTRLCAELLAQGKQPCLFYDNPAAGVIYRRLGFEDIGPWNLVFLEQV
jgi:N-acetylglutamate synthase-like GNAT family acetyltransferase